MALRRREKMKMSTAVNKVTVYLTAEEYAAMKAEAEDEGVTVSATAAGQTRAGLQTARRSGRQCQSPHRSQDKLQKRTER
jgi:hypothetical protein